MARLPWSRRGRSSELTEAAQPLIPGAAHAQTTTRGYVEGIPRGGTRVHNPGDNGYGGTDRRQFMAELHGAYLACPWSSACVDTVARTVTAGGLDVIPDTRDVEQDKPDPKPTREVLALKGLLDFVNPREDIRQLYRGVIVDLQVFGDAFVEIVWLLGRPVALYSLDSPTMVPISDEHGQVTEFVQFLDGGREAHFKPHEVIHISLDSPRGGIYGVGPTQKNLLPITTWLYTSALLKEQMRKGDPPRVHVDFPLEAQDTDVEVFSQKYQVRNLGVANIGNPVMSRGGVSMAEMQVNKIAEYLATLKDLRDQILSGYGVPPSKVGVIESGNLGGGTGTSQDKTFRVNTCGPYDELALEKFNYQLTRQGFGIPDWRIRSGEVDWRDDKVVEDIRDTRLRNGSWDLNRYRAEIGEPAVDGGDDAVLVDRHGVVTWADLAALSTATVAGAAKGIQPASPELKPTETLTEAYLQRRTEALRSLSERNL